MLPSALSTASAPALTLISWLNTVPTRSLCTLRRGRRLPRRNTRYQAGATPYLDRTFTGWTAPASPGAPLLLHRNGLSPSTPCQSPGALPLANCLCGFRHHEGCECRSASLGTRFTDQPAID